MNCSSDSEDDLLPTFDTFNAVFNKVHEEARKAPPPKPSSSSKSNSSKKSSKGKHECCTGETDGTTLNFTLKDAKQCDMEFSKDTKELLDEIDMLTKGGCIPHDDSKIKSEFEAPRLKSAKGKPKPSGVKTRSKLKRGKQKVVQEIVQISDDDDEELEGLNSTFNNSDNIEPMTVEPVQEICSIRIRWMQELIPFRVTKQTKMSEIRNKLADKISKRADNLIILDETSSDEVSDNVTVGSIPFGKTLEVFVRQVPLNIDPKKLDPNCILIKLQGCGGYRERYTVSIKRTTSVKQLIEDFKEKFKCQEKKFKLVFDGEKLDLSETPESLDMENNDMIDVVEI